LSKRGHYKGQSLVDLVMPLTDYDKSVMAKVQGKDPPLPEPRPSPHAPGCWCVRCWDAGMQYAHYLEQKRSQEI
jgi:hypothetical protein